MSEAPVTKSGTFQLGDRPVHRLGFGAMRLTGPGIWGPPQDPAECLAVLRRAVELGVDLIDTADSYGPYVSEELIRQALHPYPERLRIATKAGLVRTGPGQWAPVGRPAYLRQECEMSLRRLGVDVIDLFQLHRIDPLTAAEAQFEELRKLQEEGKVRLIGLSNVSVADIEAARQIVPVATVQNPYNVLERRSEDVLEHCEREGIGFIPYFPVVRGDAADTGAVADVAGEAGVTASQVALAWLLQRSPVVLPIPGTSQVAHLEENCAAATVALSPSQLASLNGLAA